MNWFNVVKKDKTKQGKLPKELVEGATVSTRPLKDWFKRPKKSKPKKADDTTTQTSLDEFEE